MLWKKSWWTCPCRSPRPRCFLDRKQSGLLCLYIYLLKRKIAGEKEGKGKWTHLTQIFAQCRMCTFFRARSSVHVPLLSSASHLTFFSRFVVHCCVRLLISFFTAEHLIIFINTNRTNSYIKSHSTFFFFFKCVGVLFLSSPLTYSPTHLSPLLTWAGLHCSTLWRGASLSLKDFCFPTSVDEKTNGSRRNHTCGGL